MARVRALLDGPPVSAVGGAVRDALLGRPPAPRPELDLVVEGDAIALAHRLGRALGARVTAHPRFGTAAIEVPHGGHLDLVSARLERYPAPGALPTVAPGTLADDLARRDFTVNAMAVRLSGPGAGELVDPHGGRADVERGLVRALRADAFEEDPSRVVRAARYAARLGFALAPGTRAAAEPVAARLDPGSSRVADELRRLLDEPAAAAALDLLADLGVPWVERGGLAARLAALEAARAHPRAPDVPVWALRMGAAVAPEAVARLALPGWARAVAAEAREGEQLARRLVGAPAPSAVDRLLQGAPPAAAIGALAAGAGAVARWWDRDRDREIAVGGADLVRAGIPPGPAIGRALRAVREAVLDGRVEGRKAQLELALAVAREEA